MISPFFLLTGKFFHCHPLQAKQLRAAIQALMLLVLFLPEPVIVLSFDKKGSYLLQLKSRNTAAILTGFSLILRCFFFSYLQEPLKLYYRAGTDRLDLTMATVFIKNASACQL